MCFLTPFPGWAGVESNYCPPLINGALSPLPYASRVASNVIPQLRVYRIASFLKRWRLASLHASVSPEHFDRYPEEYVVRFNRRSSTQRDLLFYLVLKQAVQAPPAPCEDIIAG